MNTHAIKTLAPLATALTLCFAIAGCNHDNTRDDNPAAMQSSSAPTTSGDASSMDTTGNTGTNTGDTTNGTTTDSNQSTQDNTQNPPTTPPPPQP